MLCGLIAAVAVGWQACPLNVRISKNVRFLSLG